MKKRSKHSLSHYKLLTIRPGGLYPCGLIEVNPGDSIRHRISALTRVIPLVSPVMHPVSLRLHCFFVPMRLLWDGWEEFITGGPDGEGGDSGEIPRITAGGGGFAAKGLLDYLGVPPGVAGQVVNAFAVRAYNKIYNENFRDQDLITPLPVPTTSGPDTTSPLVIQNIAWEKDQFTSARLTPQKGPDVTLPLGTTAPVRGIGVTTGTANAAAAAGTESDGGTVAAGTRIYGTANIQIVDALNTAGNAGSGGHMPNIYADLSEASGATIIALKEAIALQSFQEARQMFGSEYVDFLRFLGIRPSDSRIQRAEFLGGAKQNFAFTEVLQTGPDTDDTGVAALKGHGITAVRSNGYTRFFEEYGLMMCLLSARPRTMYTSGLDKQWFRAVKEDWWQPQWERVGMEEIFNKEIRAAHADPDGTFGFNERYTSYRYMQSGICGEFRSTLNYWHLGRAFGSDPALNQSFVECEPRDNIYADTSADTDKMYVMVNHSIQARRLLGKRSQPGRTL